MATWKHAGALALLAAAALTTGCKNGADDETVPDAGTFDSPTFDIAIDRPLDGLPEARVDAPVEATVDAPAEAALDAPVEAHADAPVEAMADAPDELAVDAPAEAQGDATPDAGPETDAGAEAETDAAKEAEADAATLADASDASVDAAADASDEPDAGPQPMLVRFVHAAGDKPAVAYDACYRAHGAPSWSGPALAQDGAPGGLAFGDVSRRFEVPGDSPWDVSIIPAPATDCAGADSGIVFSNIFSVGGMGALLAALPEGRVSMNIEEPRGVAGGTSFAFSQLASRATGYDLDLQAAGGGITVQDFTNGQSDAGVVVSPLPLLFPTAVWTGSHALPTGSDVYGYVTLPVGQVQATLRLAGALDGLTSVAIALGDGEVRSVIVLGDGTQAVALLDCNDTKVVGSLTACTKYDVTETVGAARLRVAQLVPDFGQPVQICAKPMGSDGAYARVAPVPGSIDYPTVSAYATVEARGLELRVVGELDDCQTQSWLFETSYRSVAASESMTWMLAGLHNGQPQVVDVLLHDETAPPGQGYLVRPISAVPRTDIGFWIGPGSVGSSGPQAWGFGQFATLSTSQADPNGYVSSTDTNDLWSVVHDTNGVQSDAVWSNAVDTTYAPLLSVFAIGGVNGLPEQLLVCTDAINGEGTPGSCDVAVPYTPRGLRVANLASSLAAADVCVRNTPANPAAPWTDVTPHLAASNGAPVPLSVGSLSGLWPVAGVGPGAAQLRLVDVGATGCDTPLSGWSDVSFDAGLDPRGALLALFNTTTGNLVDAVLYGTPRAPSASLVGVRFLNARNALNLDVGETTSGGTVLTSRWGTFATYEQSCIEADLFKFVYPAPSPGPVAFGTSSNTGPSGVLASVDVATLGGHLYDAFALAPGGGFQLVLCDEGDAPKANGLVPCAVSLAP